MGEHIAIIGGGMTATYLLKHFIESGDKDISITIFEKGPNLGPGMAYDRRIVNPEHLANSGSQEIPDLEIPLHEWLRNKSDAWLEKHGIVRADISKGSIYPRVVLGAYFIEQFKELCKNAEQRGIKVHVINQTEVKDIIDDPGKGKVAVTVESKGQKTTEFFDKAIIATGHFWPDRRIVDGFYDSPWPIDKLSKPLNHPVAVVGTSLSAVDTVLTLANRHGKFERDPAGKLTYSPEPNTDQFSVTMFSRKGLLPDLRCYFQYPEHDIYRYVKEAEVEDHRKTNNGFVSIDFFFKKYKEAVKNTDPEFYDRIKYYDLKDFINFVVRERQKTPPFEWLKKEYAVAQKSLAERKPLYWKEILDDVTYSLSFYAKYLTAEDMLEFKRDLMPLASYVIAFMPLESAEKMIALHEAGKLDVITVGPEWSLAATPKENGATLRYNEKGQLVDKHFDTVIKAIGQQPTSIEKFPFASLVQQHVVQPMRVPFKDREQAEKELNGIKPGEPETIKKDGHAYYFYPGGIAVNDEFRMMGKDGANPRVFDLAMPDLLGCYPYTQSLPFCNHGADIVVRAVERERLKPVVGTWTAKDARGGDSSQRALP